MKRICTFLLLALAITHLPAQNTENLPRYLTNAERALLDQYSPPASRGIEFPPPFENIRTMAEWEEIQALTITWRSYPSILKQIVRASQDQTRVIIFSENPGQTESYLLGSSAGGPLDNLDNIEIVNAQSNSVWIRDYGANTVYGNRVDTLFLVDWIYNRPRPDDDVIPDALAAYLELNLFSTSGAPNDIVNTGGNFMSNGQGQAFASELVLEENEPGATYSIEPKSEEEIDEVMAEFMGLNSYIKMTQLPYDIINHIDMHMKFLDEETLLVGEYPEGVADGPQINANIDYVINTFNSYFDTPFKVVRMPMPDSPGGSWPDDNPPASYRTYTNGIFVNKTYIYPSYREEYDTTAARIYQELLPGYNLVPIDCDNSGGNIIAAAGAIHCITHSVGVSDPLLIVHQPLADTEDEVNPYLVSAEIEHRSGIAGANLYWRLEGETAYNSVAMNFDAGNTWLGNIPAQDAGSTIQYYVEGLANNGKVQNRPIVAPEGFWHFEVLGAVLGLDQLESVQLKPVYPNPASNLLSIPVHSTWNSKLTISIFDATGRKIEDVFSGDLYGERRFSLFVDNYAPGTYLVVAKGKFGKKVSKLQVIH